MEAKMKRLFPFIAALLYLLSQTVLAEVRNDGLHKQPWFHQSFLELADDVHEAADEGKFLVVLIEQSGCPYCRELHEVNFKRSEITDYLGKHALVLQLDLWGAREVVAFDGEAMEERDWIQSQGIHFTPTTLIYTRNAEGAAKEVFRLPGYLKPFHYLSSLEYVFTGEYEKQSFQRYLQDKFSKLAEKGINPEVW
jgi:thioredoxin-related protein